MTDSNGDDRRRQRPRRRRRLNDRGDWSDQTNRVERTDRVGRVGRVERTDRIDRAQSAVVGVALLVAITVVSLGLLTAGTGVVMDEHATAIAADRAAADLTDAIESTSTPGERTVPIAVSTGTLRTVDRSVRVHDGDGWTRHEANGIAYRTGTGTRDHRVVAVAGAVVRVDGSGATVARHPSILVSEEVVLVTLPVVTGSFHTATDGTSGSGGSSRMLAMTVTHDRRSLGEGPLRVAIETSTPAALERSLRGYKTDPDVDATVTRHQFEGDAHESVVIRIHGDRARYVLRHGIDVEVYSG